MATSGDLRDDLAGVYGYRPRGPVEPGPPPLGPTAVVSPATDASVDVRRAQWLIRHVDMGEGHAVTKRDYYDQCACGDTYGRRLVATLNLPCLRCVDCGCRWRDNLDGTVSLLVVGERSCPKCEAQTGAPQCAIHWLHVSLEVAP